MIELFIYAIFGHLVGDYLLQSKKMALEKSAKNWRGFLICILHTLIYTASIFVVIWKFNILAIIIIFVSHFIIDRWSLGQIWLKLIKGRTFESAYSSQDKNREFDIAFTSIVYTVVDNTFHLLILWFVLKLI
jgi:membrane-associated HD superfamily phosphohydrolase